MCRHADVNAQIPNDALDHRRGDLKLREAKDAPAVQSRFEILLGVGGEALRSVVATLDVDAALDLDERAALDMGEISAPLAFHVETELAF